MGRPPPWNHSVEPLQECESSQKSRKKSVLLEPYDIYSSSYKLVRYSTVRTLGN